MVDALREVHRVLTPSGVLVDARPDSRVLAFAERQNVGRPRLFGEVMTNRVERSADGASDRAVAQVKREGLFRSMRRGRFWHRVPFDNLAEVRQYLREHLRFVHRPRWVVDEATRRRHAGEPFVIRRAVRYELLVREADERQRGKHRQRG